VDADELADPAGGGGTGVGRRFHGADARIAYDESVVAASILIAHLGSNLVLLLQDLDRGSEFSLALTGVGLKYADFEGELKRRLK